MSWQEYVKTLMATQHLTACGIFGIDGSVWAASHEFPLNAENIKQVIASTLDISKAADGVSAKGERYILVKGDPGVSVILKKGPNGIVAYRSTQCCIIALHDNNVKTEIAVTDVGRVIDHLSKHGY